MGLTPRYIYWQLTYVAYICIFLQAKLFFKARVVTKGCNCGEAIVLSLQKALPFANITVTTPAKLRNYIESNKVGCVGKTMRTGRSSRTCVHIKHTAVPKKLLLMVLPVLGYHLISVLSPNICIRLSPYTCITYQFMEMSNLF